MSTNDSGDEPEHIARQILQHLNEAEEQVKNLYIAGCESLWVKGTPKQECGARFAKIVRDLKYPNDPKAEWHSGYYWDVVKQAGFTRNTPVKEPKDSSPVPLKLELDNPETWEKSPNYKQRLPFIQFLQEDMALTKEMITELQKNYEDKELADGTKVADIETPRQWHKLFSNTDMKGNVTPEEGWPDMSLDVKDKDGNITHHHWPKEAGPVDDYFKLLRDLRAKIQGVLQKCMDGRQLLMPWMIFPLKARADIVSKAYWGKQYYVHFKRRFTITTKKITQFEESHDTVADYLNFVATDSWQWGYAEFIPCPHCVVEANPAKIDTTGLTPEEVEVKKRVELENSKAYLLQMFPLEDGTWKWKCANCSRLYSPLMMKEMLERVANDANGMATVYLQRVGVPIPQGSEVSENDDE